MAFSEAEKDRQGCSGQGVLQACLSYHENPAATDLLQRGKYFYDHVFIAVYFHWLCALGKIVFILANYWLFSVIVRIFASDCCHACGQNLL